MTATRVFLVLFSLLSLVLNIAGQICTPDALGATAVLGSATNVFTSAGSLAGATGVHIERSSTSGNQGKVWVVLSTGATIARFTNAYALSSSGVPEYSLVATNGGTISMSGPTFITTDSVGTCYVSDTGNHRVLIFGACYAITTTTAAPTGVLGQANLNAGSNTAGTTTGISMNIPQGIGFDSTITGAPSTTNPIFVVNRGFNEIILFSLAITTTTMQAASTLSFGTNNAVPGTTTSDLSSPTGMAVAQALDVMFIADTGNHRIMTVAAARTAGAATVGIALGSGTTGCGAAVLASPRGVSYDVTNNVLYIADTSNNRIVFASATAAGVLATALTGQMFPAGGVVTACTAAGVTQNSASVPTDVDAVPAGAFSPSTAGGPTLIFSDQTNQRALKVCSGTVSASISGTNAVALSPSPSFSAGSAAGVSPSLSASIGSAAISKSLSASVGAAAGVSVSLSASGGAGATVAASVSVTVTVTGTVSVTATNSYSPTNSQSFSLTVSRSYSITVSQSYSITVSYSYTPSYTASYTNSITTSVTNSYSASKAKFCGNGIVEGSEQCDLGTTNGQKHVCCSRRCRNKKGGRRCYRQKNECLSHPRCDGVGNCRSAEIHEDSPCKLSTGLTGKCNGSGVCVA